MKHVLLFFAVAFTATTAITPSLAQGEIPVNMYTGTPGISIPMYTLQDHDLSENISLVYDPNDLRLNAPHRYGVGWDIPVGGAVSRKVRGLPDDFIGVAGDIRQGWLYGTNYSDVLTFPNSADNLTSTYTDETNDEIFIGNRQTWLKDSEPDLFSFSVGGYSGSFVFGNDGNIQLIPYQDILIVPNFQNAPTDKTIISWTITTNDGVVYTLDQASTTTYQLSKFNDPQGVDQTQITAFERDYQYFESPMTYRASWMVSSAASPSGATLTYTFSSKTSRVRGADKRGILFDAQWQNGLSVFKLNEFTLMTETVIDVIKYVTSVKTSTGFTVTLDSATGVKVYDDLRSPTDSFKEFLFTYDGAFLSSVTETDHAHCNQMPPYRMYYNHKEYYPTVKGQWMQNQDFWGFNNEADNVPGTSIPTIYVYPDKPATERYRIYPIPGYSGRTITLYGNAYRVASSNGVTIGTLTRLVYPAGGEADITFEPNTYYDAEAGIDQVGGGVRIKSLVYYNGVDVNQNVVRNFNYTDASGHSSGRLITRPAYAIPTWQYVVPTTAGHTGYSKQYSQLTGDFVWRDLTLLTGWDISNQETTSGSVVGYSKVTTSRPLSGKTVFDYTLPGTYGSSATGATGTDWIPTTTKFARGSNVTMGIIQGAEVGGYAMFPNTPYDYERGLLITKSEYNEGGTLVRKTDNTYQYIYKGTQPVPVVALAYDPFANITQDIFLYGRYTNITNVAKVVATETVTTYDENNTSKSAANVTQFTYASPYHRYVSKVTRTLPDGTVYGTLLKYTLDYPATAPSDPQLQMTELLKSTNRNAVVIEQQNTIKLFGGTEKTTDAMLMRFAPFGLNKPLLQSTQAFRPLAPVTDFVSSSVVGNAFNVDSRYETVSTVNEYSSTYNLPLSATGENKTTNATLFGFSNRAPVAQVSMAQTSEVAFSDFETTNIASFTLSGAYYGTGRTGLNGLHPSATLTRTITKRTSAPPTKYLLSFWLKNPGASVTLTVTLKDGNNVQLSSTNYTYGASANYQYIVQPIDISGIATTSFTITLTGQGFTSPGSNSPTLLPLLDDVAFYPDYASISSVTYDMPFGVNSSTNGIGITSYTNYDPLGRVRYIRDQDNNIRKRYTYNYTGQVTPTLVANVTNLPSTYCVRHSYTFVAQDQSCLTGATYQWNFGDGGGFTAASSSLTAPAHVYVAAGTYSLTLRALHPDYAAPVDQVTTAVVTMPPLVANISNLVSSYTAGQSSTFTAQAQPCLEGALYQWDFGEGAGFTAASASPTINYTFLTVGSHTLKLRVTHPNYTSPATPVDQTVTVNVVRPPLSQTTCAGGVQSLDANGIITSYYTCRSGVPDGWIQIAMTVSNAYGDVINYQWQKRDSNVSTWTDVSGATSSILPQMKVEKTMQSFFLRCVATSNDGRTINSDAVSVTTAIN